MFQVETEKTTRKLSRYIRYKVSDSNWWRSEWNLIAFQGVVLSYY